MRRLHLAAAALATLILSSLHPLVGHQGGGPQQPLRQWWVNKDEPGRYGSNKPHVKLADLKARHQGQTDWSEVVVDDVNYHATYNSAPSGAKVGRRVHPDTREFFVVIEGQIRFTIEGQEPVVATRGSVVNIPKKNVYSFEVAGSAPALWVDANQQHYTYLYPIDEPKPVQLPQHGVMKVGINMEPAPYAGNNRPHFNLFEAEKDPTFAGQNVVQDDHMWALAIWGSEKNLPPYDPHDKGHFHVGTAEWWVIMEGQIRHNIETVGDFTSSEGDVVYVPPSTWHATRFRGPGPACRLAISGYQFTNLLEVVQ